MNIRLITLFPNETDALFRRGVLGRAIEKGVFAFSTVDLRQFGIEPHKKVDDTPFGGGAGMVLRADVIAKAISSIEDWQNYRILYPCPKGPRLNQEFAATFSKEEGIIFISGYYEGLDERVFDLFPIERISIGDFVLSSGDLPSLVITETVVRLLPGVLGNPESVQQDSYLTGLLEYPQYTQPRNLQSLGVPEELTGGHHQKIHNWKLKKSIEETLIRKPSLLATSNLTSEAKTILAEFIKGEKNGRSTY